MKGKEGREEEAHVEGGVEDKGSSECVLDPDTSRAPKFSRAIPDATPGDRATHTILPPPSSNSPLEKSSKFRGEGNFSRIFLLFRSIPPYYPTETDFATFHSSSVSFHRESLTDIDGESLRFRGLQSRNEFDEISSLKNKSPSSLDCPRTLLPLFSPKSHQRNVVVEGKIDY